MECSVIQYVVHSEVAERAQTRGDTVIVVHLMWGVVTSAPSLGTVLVVVIGEFQSEEG